MLDIIEVGKYEKSDEEFKDLMRPIKDAMTDLVNDHFLKYNENEMLLVSTIFKVVNRDMTAFKQKYGLKDKDAVFMFKGGNVLRLINANALRYLPPDAVTVIDGLYKQYLKQSDNDFTIYLNPNLQNWDSIYQELMYLILHSLATIRDVYTSNLKEFFDVYNLNQKSIDKIIMKKIDEVNKLGIIECKTLTTAPTPDRIVLFNEQNDTVLYEIAKGGSMLNNKTAFYNSLNDALRFANDYGKLIRFGLCRTKVNFRLNNVLNVGGELIDISISHKEDKEMRHLDSSQKFYRFIDDNVIMGQHNNVYDFNYNIVNLNYIIDDLMRILFVEKVYPWDDRKYAKRLNRLFYFIYIYMLDEKAITIKHLEFINEQFGELATPHFEFSNRYLEMLSDKIKTLHYKMVELNGDRDAYNTFLETVIKNINAIHAINKGVIEYLRGVKIPQSDLYELQNIV